MPWTLKVGGVDNGNGFANASRVGASFHLKVSSILVDTCFFSCGFCVFRPMIGCVVFCLVFKERMIRDVGTRKDSC